MEINKKRGKGSKKGKRGKGRKDLEEESEKISVTNNPMSRRTPTPTATLCHLFSGNVFPFSTSESVHKDHKERHVKQIKWRLFLFLTPLISLSLSHHCRHALVSLCALMSSATLPYSWGYHVLRNTYLTEEGMRKKEKRRKITKSRRVKQVVSIYGINWFGSRKPSLHEALNISIFFIWRLLRRLHVTS
jgi:hypothetical protein